MANIREILYQSIKGFSQRKIARSHNISRQAVAKYILLGIASGLSKNTDSKELDDIALKICQDVKSNISVKRHVMDLLTTQTDKISEWLKEPNMTHTQIQRLLSLEGVCVSRRSINRFIERNLCKQKCTVHLKTEPGAEGQVDFGYVGMMTHKDGALRRTYASIMTLSHSRYRYVEFVTSQNAVSWAQLHVNAFEFFKGVPKCILLDNLKAGVIKADIYDPVLNASYSELSRFYGFVIDPAKVYKPAHKGKVERSVRIVKEQLIAGKSYSSIEQANIEAKQWCKNDIAKRICTSTGKTPEQVFEEEEKGALLPLPQGFFDCPMWVVAKVHKDHHFTVKGNFYSCPTQYIGKEIEVRIGLRTISAYYQHKIIKTHPRSLDKGQWITDTKDYPESALSYLENDFERCLEESTKIGPAAQTIIKHCSDSGGKVNLRKAQGILRLQDKYNSKRLEKACKRALTFNNYSYGCILNILSKDLDNVVSIIYQDARSASYIRTEEEYSSSMEANYE